MKYLSRKVLMVRFIIIHTIIFKMTISKQHFLFVLICSLIVESQVLSPVTNCLGRCLTCDPLSLSDCTAPSACEWGYYNPQGNGTCLSIPTAKVINSQLGQKEDKSLKTVASGWSDSARLTVCQYLSSHGTKYMDVIGFYEGVEMLQKTFEVDPSSQVFYFSFNLLRDQWLPFNDFMIIDVSSGNKNIETLEISYDRRITLDSQPAAIKCGTKRVLSQKFTIAVENKQRVGKTLSFLFTSFLYSSTWGLTNVQLVSGCKGYSMYNNKTQQCNKCDKDSFIVKTQGAEWCQKCPFLCLTCQSKEKCLTCIGGAALDSSTKCAFPQNSKTQFASLGENQKVCGTTPLKIGSLGTPILLSELKNENDLLYDEIQIGFVLYYLPSDWIKTNETVLSVFLNKIQIMKISNKNLTNLATDSCDSFKLGKTAKIELFSDKIIHTDNVIQLQFRLEGKNAQMEFGVSDVRVKSLKKAREVPQQSPPQLAIAPVIQTKQQANTSVVPKLLTETSQSQSKDIIVQPIIHPISPDLQTIQAENLQKLPIVENNLTIQGEQKNPINESKLGTQTEDRSEIGTQPQIQSEAQHETQQKPQPETQQKTQPEAKLDTQPELETQHQTQPEVQLDTQPDTQPEAQPETQQKTLQLKSQKEALQEKSSLSSTPQQKKSPLSSPLQSDESPLPTLPQSDQSLPSGDSNDTEVQDFGNIGFLPTVSNKKSGIQVFIDNQPEESYLYNVKIDKLRPDQYQIESYYLQDNKLNMFITIDKSFTKGTISIYRSSTSRLLQQSGEPVLVGTFKIARFDSLTSNQIQSVECFAWLFTAAAWIAVIGIIIAVFSGFGIVVEEYVLLLQVIFLHVYIASDYLPLTFRDVVGGLSLVENLNFFLPVHSESIQRQWMGNVIQNGPVRFYLFNTDINFLGEFYPIILINIIYFLWFLCLKIGRYYLNKDLIDEEKTLLHRLLDNIAGRVINFCDQIWRYQFLATMWFCFIQFYNFTYPEGSNRSQGVNTAICILAFLCSLAWPIFITFYCRKQYYQTEYSQYLNNYEDIYYLKIPQFELPSNHHRMGYPLLKTVKFLVIALIICYLGNVATPTLLILIGVHLFELIYIHKQQIYSDKQYFTLRIIENTIFIAIEVILLGMLNFSSLAVSDSYIYLGYILAAVAFLAVLNGLVRITYLAHQKYKSLKKDCFEGNEKEEEKKPKTQRVV